MNVLKHEHGTGVKQVETITMHEAGNATHYADSFSVHGVAMCAVYSLGPLLGGCKTRVLNGINLAGLSLLDVFEVNKQSFQVTCVTVVFRDTNYPDMQGNSEAHAPHAERYVDQI